MKENMLLQRLLLINSELSTNCVKYEGLAVEKGNSSDSSLRNDLIGEAVRRHVMFESENVKPGFSSASDSLRDHLQSENFLGARGLSHRAADLDEVDDLRSGHTERHAVERLSFTPDERPRKGLDADAESIANHLNEGRSDLAVSKLSHDMMHLSVDDSNRLLVKVSQNEFPEIENDDRGHLLLSDWNEKYNTWTQVYVSERDQLYRFVQPGNTLSSIASDRLGTNDKDAVDKYVQNIAAVNHIPAPDLILRGQALRLPYPA